VLKSLLRGIEADLSHIAHDGPASLRESCMQSGISFAARKKKLLRLSLTAVGTCSPGGHRLVGMLRTTPLAEMEREASSIRGRFKHVKTQNHSDSRGLYQVSDGANGFECQTAKQVLIFVESVVILTDRPLGSLLSNLYRLGVPMYSCLHYRSDCSFSPCKYRSLNQMYRLPCT
jgi:hypothetical protein